jgi:hypothetical protein
MNIENKTVLITGANHGCGEAQTRVADLRHEQGDDPVSAGQAVVGVADPEVASSSSAGTRVTIARI